MLNQSQMHSFIDENKEFVVHFVEGQKIIHDLAMIHNLKGSGFAFFRDSVLSAIPLITLLKFKENLGLYVDNKDPYFMLKIEMGESGFFRTLLLPETLDEFPDTLSGEARLSKIYAGQNKPYTSIIECNGLNFHQVVNQILRESYQIKGEVIVSEESDQAVFLMQLPRKNWDKEEDTGPVREYPEFEMEILPIVKNIFKSGYNEAAPIKEQLEKAKLQYLTTKELDFKCSCSYERMVSGVGSLIRSNGIDDIYGKDDKIETKCDYCKTFYEIPKSEFLKN